VLSHALANYKPLGLAIGAVAEENTPEYRGFRVLPEGMETYRRIQRQLFSSE
jgi:hypothetical protein